MLASLYRLLKMKSIPHTLPEVSAASGISTRNISNAYKLLFPYDYLHLKPSETVERYCSKLEIDRKDSHQLHKLMVKKDIDSIINHHSSTISAACIYVYCKIHGLKVCLTKVCDIVGLSAISVTRVISRYNLHELLSS